MCKCCIVHVNQSQVGCLIKTFEILRSEKITDCLNPKWTTKFQLKYVFEERQLVKFGIYDIDSRSADLRNHDPLGELECSLGEIMANQSKGESKLNMVSIFDTHRTTVRNCN